MAISSTKRCLLALYQIVIFEIGMPYFFLEQTFSSYG
jgi:hypothetical protein